MNAAHEFCLALRQAGLLVEETFEINKIVRVKTLEDSGSKKSGWYIFYADEVPTGAFGNWKAGFTQTWSSTKTLPLPAIKRREMAQHLARVKAAQDEEVKRAQALAAQACREIWERSTEASPQNSYCQTKDIKPYGCHEFEEKDTLLVPIYKSKGELVNIQFIYADGKKCFKTTGERKGCYCPIGRDNGTKTLIVCEGYATGASIFEATGILTIVTFEADNLAPVAVRLRRQLPDWHIIIAGDTDLCGTRQKKAEQAAVQVGGVAVFPNFSGHLFDSDFQENGAGAAFTDFNDLATVAGLQTVADQILLEPDQIKETLDEAQLRVLSATHMSSALHHMMSAYALHPMQHQTAA